MTSKRYRRLGAALGGVAVLCMVYGSARRYAGEPARDHEFFERAGARPLVIAHRGGAGLWPENTVYAFERALAAGVDVLEMDVRVTADGVPVVMHDATVDRTTDGAGRVSGMSFAELSGLDAGYRWTPDGGRSFPLRGRGVKVPSLREVFVKFPDARFNIEPKTDAASPVKELCREVREHGAEGRVLIASFNSTALDEVRRECPGVATSGSPPEVSKFLALHKAGLGVAYSPSMQALQVPEFAGGVRVLTGSFVEAAHARNLDVHAWTVNEVDDMRRFLEMGVDGIITDYPDRLLGLLNRAPNP